MVVLTRASLLGLILGGLVLVASAQQDSSAGVKLQTAKKDKAASSGEALFQTHCNRCHVAPGELSPKATGAVLMHMRVRAILSKQEQQALLAYLAPGGNTP